MMKNKFIELTPTSYLHIDYSLPVTNSRKAKPFKETAKNLYVVIRALKSISEKWALGRIESIIINPEIGEGRCLFSCLVKPTKFRVIYRKKQYHVHTSFSTKKITLET